MCTQCSEAHLVVGESLGSERPGAGHVQGSREEQMGTAAHSGYLLAPPIFWACVLSLVISDLVNFLHLLRGGLMICDRVLVKPRLVNY